MSYNWYDRNRNNSYGDYKIINGIGLYYNEDSGKWVNRLNKKIIEEKYIRYEFSIYDDRDIERDFGYKNIDRVGKFLFLLYKSGIELERLKGDRFVFVDSSNVVSGILGSNYRDIIKVLDEEINVIDLRFGKGKFGKVKVDYKLNDEFFDDECFRRNVFIRNSRLIRFLDKYYNRKILSDKYLEYEVQVCSRINLDYNEVGLKMLLEKRLNRVKREEYYSKDWDFISNKLRKKRNIGWDDKRDKEYIRDGLISFELMKLDIDVLKYGGFNFNGFSSDKKFSGRISNIINNKEKEFRNLLKIDKDNLVDIDMVNGYVSLLYRVFRGIRDIKKGDNVFDDKIKEVVGDINANDFLDKYEMCFAGDEDKREDFYKLVGLNLGRIDIIVGENERGYVKSLVLYLINGDIKDGERKNYLDGKYSYDEIMEIIFCKGGVNVFRLLKSSSIDFKFGNMFYGYEMFKNMSKILMFMEVIVMKGIWDVLIKRGIAYISLYDGMLIKKKDRFEVMDICSNYLINDFDCIRMKLNE